MPPQVDIQSGTTPANQRSLLIFTTLGSAVLRYACLAHQVLCVINRHDRHISSPRGEDAPNKSRAQKQVSAEGNAKHCRANRPAPPPLSFLGRLLGLMERRVSSLTGALARPFHLLPSFCFCHSLSTRVDAQHTITPLLSRPTTRCRGHE